MNLGHVSEELFKVVKIQVGARELSLDEIPDPLEESCTGDVRCICSLVHTTCKQGDKLSSGGDNQGS